MLVLIILHSGIIRFQIGKFSHHMWVPMFKSVREFHFYIIFLLTKIHNIEDNIATFFPSRIFFLTVFYYCLHHFENLIFLFDFPRFSIVPFETEIKFERTNWHFRSRHRYISEHAKWSHLRLAHDLHNKPNMTFYSITQKILYITCLISKANKEIEQEYQISNCSQILLLFFFFFFFFALWF